MTDYMYGVAMGVVKNYNQLVWWQQAVYILYIVSSFFGPYYMILQGQKYRRGSNGMGDTCIWNMLWQAVWRFPPLLYSFLCFEYLVFPVFFGVLLDILARAFTIHSALGAKKRVKLGIALNDGSEETRQQRVMNFYGYTHDIKIEQMDSGKFRAQYYAIDEKGHISVESVHAKSFVDLEDELRNLVGSDEFWDGNDRRGVRG